MNILKSEFVLFYLNYISKIHWHKNHSTMFCNVDPIAKLYKLQFELSLLLHLPSNLSVLLTSCHFSQKWGIFQLKLWCTKMTASTMRSFWYLIVLTWYAVHKKLESQEGKVFPFHNFHEIFAVFFLHFELIISCKIVCDCFEMG